METALIEQPNFSESIPAIEHFTAPEPVPITKVYPINHANARLLAIKGNARKAELKAERLAKEAQAKPSEDQREHAEKLRVLELQLVRVDQLIAEAEDAKAFFALTSAKDKLLGNFYVLKNIPGPGTRKPKPEPATRRSTDICEPIED